MRENVTVRAQPRYPPYIGMLKDIEWAEWRQVNMYVRVCTVQWYIRRVIVSHVRCSSLLHTGQPCLDFARTIAVLNAAQLLV
jgi:hypothetical protein